MVLSLHYARAHCVQINKIIQLIRFWQQAFTSAGQSAPFATGVGPAQASLGGMPHDNVHGSALSKPLQPRNTFRQMTSAEKHDSESAFQSLKKPFKPPKRISQMATSVNADSALA